MVNVEIFKKHFEMSHICRTSLALMMYRETITAGVTPTMDELCQVLGCLQLPHDVSVRNRLIENLGVHTGISEGANIYSFINGFGEFDPRAISLVEVSKQFRK